MQHLSHVLLQQALGTAPTSNRPPYRLILGAILISTRFRAKKHPIGSYHTELMVPLEERDQMPTLLASNDFRLQKRDFRGGFTLIEMALALALLAMLASLALPFVQSDSGPTALRSKAFEIVTLLRTARNAAVLSMSDLTISVDPNTGTIRAQRHGMVKLASTMSLRISASSHPGFLFRANGTARGGRLSIMSGNDVVDIAVDDMTAVVRIVSERYGRD